MRAMKRAATLGVALVLGAAAGGAQQPAGADPRWQAFVGCWEPEGAFAGTAALILAVMVAAAIRARRRKELSS